jgi:hypothetical protein
MGSVKTGVMAEIVGNMSLQTDDGCGMIAAWPELGERVRS